MTDTNDAPTDLVLDNKTVAENSLEGTAVGQLSISDFDSDSIHSSYQVIKKSLTWEESRIDAEILGGHLAVINTAEIWEMVLGLDGLQSGLYIGATDQQQEGNWKWLSGEALANLQRTPDTFHAWHPNEPNGNNNEHFAIISNVRGYGWNDLNSRQQEGYILETPPYSLVSGDAGGGLGCVLYSEAEFLLDKCASGIGKTDTYIVLVFDFIVERIYGHQFAALDGKG